MRIPDVWLLWLVLFLGVGAITIGITLLVINWLPERRKRKWTQL